MGVKRIKGVDRALMLLCRQARKYWRFYAPSYKDIQEQRICNGCKKKVDYVEVDHEPPLGPRPRTFEELGPWLTRMFHGPVQGLCKAHHLEKTKAQRKKKCKKTV